MMPPLSRKQAKPPIQSAAPETKPSQPATGGAGAVIVPRGRRWFYRGMVVVGLPFSALLAAELLLRILGFGHPTDFFVPSRIADKPVLVENPWFGLSFFPPALARSPNPIVIEAQKPPGMCRIFLFGGSAALGDPRPAYGVGRYLETLLRRRFPGREFEVVCVAMTAINSHAILPIARECARYQGDFWIIYMGNNEFAGPFGANTVFGPQAPPGALVRGYLALQRTRVGQGLVALARYLQGANGTPAAWGGLRMFLHHQLSPTDPRRERVYENFRQNVFDILQAGTRSGARVILSSVASNLKDCPPFSSLEPVGLEATSQARWKQLCEQGASLAQEKRFAEALKPYTEALEIAPRDAELQFRLSQCFLAMTNLGAAAQGFARARDWDALPFRADTRLNRIIADAASRYEGKGVGYIDAEQALARLSPCQIPGGECFYEHVHLNPSGNYCLARAFADQVANRLPPDVLRSQTAGWADPETCARDLGLTDWNRYAALEEISRRLSDAPYTNQLDAARRLQDLHQQLADLKRRLQPDAAPAARLAYEEALQRRPRDPWLHHNYAEFLTACGDLAQATTQLEAVRDLLPQHYAAYLQLGRLLVVQKRYDEALRSLQAASRLRPDAADIYLELGQVYSRQGKLDLALEQYAIVLRAQPDHAGVRLLRAQILERQNKRDQAIQSLREAVRLQPSYREAHDLLGIELGLKGKLPEAQAQFEEVVRLRPEEADGHLNLGISLARQKRYDAALAEFQTVLRLDPRNPKAREFVSTIGRLEAGQATPQSTGSPQ